jgi:hypothetical protein
LCLQLQPLKILRCIKWMLKLPLWMEIFQRRFIYAISIKFCGQG